MHMLPLPDGSTFERLISPGTPARLENKNLQPLTSLNKQPNVIKNKPHLQLGNNIYIEG